jgi:predicted nucleic acid-binding protein
MKYIYIDTSALIAMSDKNDKNHERAVSYFKIAVKRYFKRYKDQKIDLTDCLSFSIMERMDINTPFTFDSDFQTHGFEMLPT